MNLQSYERKTCCVEGCAKLCRNKGFYKGRTRYDRMCEFHHRGSDRAYYSKKQRIPNTKCSHCGWDKAYCDRHRKIPELGYTTQNVAVLCPNCHRLAELGIIKVD